VYQSRYATSLQINTPRRVAICSTHIYAPNRSKYALGGISRAYTKLLDHLSVGSVHPKDVFCQNCTTETKPASIEPPYKASGPQWVHVLAQTTSRSAQPIPCQSNGQKRHPWCLWAQGTIKHSHTILYRNLSGTLYF
jgi:hypothetical protein